MNVQKIYVDTLSQDQGKTISQEKSVVTDNNAESVLDDKDAESGVDVEDHDDNSNGESQTGDNLTPATRRPVRQATLAARQKLKRWLNPSENFTALGSVAISTAMITCEKDSNDSEHV